MKHLPAPIYSHQPPQQQTGTYYDAELAAALAAFQPGGPTAPRVAPALSHRAVTTAPDDPLVPRAFSRAVRTGMASPCLSGADSDVSAAATPPTLTSQYSESLSEGDGSSVGGPALSPYQQALSDSEDMCQRQSSDTASSFVNSAWMQSQRFNTHSMGDDDMDVFASLFSGWVSDDAPRVGSDFQMDPPADSGSPDLDPLGPWLFEDDMGVDMASEDIDMLLGFDDGYDLV